MGHLLRYNRFAVYVARCLILANGPILHTETAKVKHVGHGEAGWGGEAEET